MGREESVAYFPLVPAEVDDDDADRGSDFAAGDAVREPRELRNEAVAYRGREDVGAAATDEDEVGLELGLGLAVVLRSVDREVEDEDVGLRLFRDRGTPPLVVVFLYGRDIIYIHDEWTLCASVWCCNAVMEDRSTVVFVGKHNNKRNGL